MALAMPFDGKIIACDINVEWTKIAKKYWEKAGLMNKIDLRLAPALNTLHTLLDHDQAGTFDFVFIDADKKNYSAYYEKSLDLVRAGGLILIDNVLWGGDVADPMIQDENTNSIRQLNTQLLKDERVTISMLPLGDGVTLARKRNKGYLY